MLAMNRGILSALALARVDLPRAALAAQVMVNWMARGLGSMSLRAGTGYLSNTNGDARAKTIPFVFATDDVARIEFVQDELQVLVDDEAVTRPTVTAAVTNGTFLTDVASWTDVDTGSAVSDWRTGGYLGLIAASSSDTAGREQQVTVNQIGTEHALRVVVARGPAVLRVGSTSDGDDYIAETTLGTGTHSLSFTPTGASFYIRIMGRRSYSVLIDSITVEAAGVMELPTPWQETDLPLLRTEQSGDVVYVACRGYQQRKVERRSETSWSTVLYEPETGPFRVVNTSAITITPSAISGDITLTASQALFKSTNVGSLYRIQSIGQVVSETITAANVFSDPIRVAGVGGARTFVVSASGFGVATVTLQFSVGEPGAWADVTSYTVDTSISHDDGLDNQIIYYRIGVKTGQYTSGTIEVGLFYTSGSNLGVALVTAYTSSTVVDAVVLEDFGIASASSDWWESQWSDRRGWPSSVVLHESRLTFGGADAINASITDSYEDFDDEFEGDAGPISRTIGQGPVESISWLMSLTRLMIGTLSSAAPITPVKLQPSNPLSGRSSSFDEPLTPTNFNLKTTDATGAFVDASLTRLVELKWDVNQSDYVPEDLSVATPDLNEVGIVGIAVQYRPDMRIWCWRTDGTCGVLVRDRAENVVCWLEVDTDGEIEDVSVLPGTVEDRVYWNVARVVDGATVRFREKVALESECRGGTLNLQADAFVTGTNSPASTTLTGLDHWEGEDLVVWADGADLSPGVGEDQTLYTVSGGQITGLPGVVTNWMAGKSYSARWKSAKLAFAAALGSALNVRGKINRVGLILRNTHRRGLQIGPAFDELDDMPLTEDYEELSPTAIIEEYDHDKLDFDSDWGTDPRLCMVATAPRPCTVLAATVDLTKSG